MGECREHGPEDPRVAQGWGVDRVADLLLVMPAFGEFAAEVEPDRRRLVTRRPPDGSTELERIERLDEPLHVAAADLQPGRAS